MRTFRHPALAVFVLVHLSPTLAWGQAEKVGVVTTLEGNVTARRAVLPLPVPLKFKDDVFFRDTITTGDQSLARVLLGGKSIVTVRERSVVTITESPGRSFISLESGKIGLAGWPDHGGPGEQGDSAQGGGQPGAGEGSGHGGDLGGPGRAHRWRRGGSPRRAGRIATGGQIRSRNQPHAGLRSTRHAVLQS